MLKPKLDNPQIYRRLDTDKIYDSIILFQDQIIQAWTDINSLPLQPSCRNAKNIIIAGMGGSALGGHIIQSIDQAILKIPLQIVNNYRLPAYVNSNTLAIIISYSGNTEESISCFRDALNKKAQVFAITTGGKLARLASRHKTSLYLINPVANPSNHPRMGIGYLATATLAILNRCQFIHFNNQQIDEIVQFLHNNISFLRTTPIKHNPAKHLAKKLANKAILIISANHLNGVAHSISNQINESAKTFANYYFLPELNHHLLEGLSQPSQLKNYSHILLINSDLYPQAIKQRLKLTQKILHKSGYTTTIIKPDSRTPTSQAFETLYFGSFLAYYLSIESGINPGLIPWVNYFKKELIRLRKQKQWINKTSLFSTSTK